MSHNKRLVHDILSEPNAKRPVAFIQYGNPTDGYIYEAICPWCAATLEWLRPPTQKFDDLYTALLRTQQQHWTFCPANKGITYTIEMQVEIAREPLNTETLPKEHIH